MEIIINVGNSLQMFTDFACAYFEGLFAEQDNNKIYCHNVNKLWVFIYLTGLHL